MPDQVTLRFNLGSWMDEADNRALAPLGDVQVYPSVATMDGFISETLGTLRDSELNPWKHTFSESAYYANASGSSWDLVVSLAPYLEAVLSFETARMVAGAFLGALFGRILERPGGSEDLGSRQDAESISETVRDYVIRRDDVSPSQVTEIAFGQLDDKSFEVIVRRETDGHRFLFRISEDGMITGRIDLDELIVYSRRVAGPSSDEARN